MDSFLLICVKIMEQLQIIRLKKCDYLFDDQFVLAGLVTELKTN